MASKQLPKEKKSSKKTSCAVPGISSSGESRTIETRKIDNGYIVSESHWKGDSYTRRETYSATKPTVTVGVSTKGKP